MESKINILCTRNIDEELMEQAVQNGLQVDTISFIETEPIESVEVQQEVDAVFNLEATVVFTSMNAVEAVAEYLVEEQPAWQIFCIGHATKQLVQKYFPWSKIVGTADGAEALAEMIVSESAAEQVFFFCGDKRRDELPGILRNHEIDVVEITVYRTIMVPHKLEKEYQGILFFSPSAVESFFKTNSVPAATVLFAIGNSTATAIRQYAGNKIMLADQPSKQHLFGQMLEYFGV